MHAMDAELRSPDLLRGAATLFVVLVFRQGSNQSERCRLLFSSSKPRDWFGISGGNNGFVTDVAFDTHRATFYTRTHNHIVLDSERRKGSREFES